MNIHCNIWKLRFFFCLFSCTNWIKRRTYIIWQFKLNIGTCSRVDQFLKRKGRRLVQNIIISNLIRKQMISKNNILCVGTNMVL